MATRNRFHKLIIAGDNSKLTRKSSAVGATVVADYISPEGRTLVLERPAATASTKPAAKRKPKSGATGTATSFPSAPESANG